MEVLVFDVPTVRSSYQRCVDGVTLQQR